MPFLSSTQMAPSQVVIGRTKYENDGEEIELIVCKQAVHLNQDAIKQSYPAVNLGGLQSLLNSFDLKTL